MEEDSFIKTLRDHTPTTTHLYGYVLTSSVGIQHAPGGKTISQETWMVLSPEPENTYDPNAMRVDTLQGVKVGYINRSVAKKIASVLDLDKIVVEVYAMDVPEKYDLRTAVVFYGPPHEHDVDTIKTTMKCGTWFPKQTSSDQPPRKKRRVVVADEMDDPTKRRVMASLKISVSYTHLRAHET